MTVDISKLRKGDVVTAKFRILCADRDQDGEIKAESYSGSAGNSWFQPADIVSVEPRPLKVGDRAHYGRTEVHIRALENDWAWTTWPNSTSGTVIRLSDLSPA